MYLMLSSDLHPRLQSDLFLHVSPSKPSRQLSSYPCVPHVPPTSFSLIWRSSQCWPRRTKREAPSHAIFTSLILFLSPDVQTFLWTLLSNTFRPGIFLSVVDQKSHSTKQETAFSSVHFDIIRSQWPRRPRRGSAASHLLGLRVRILPGHRCLSVVSAVCCQVEVSATSWSFVQMSPADCGASLCVI